MAVFHDRVGSCVLLSNGRKTAERKCESEEYGNGIVFSAKPLGNDELFEVQIDRQVNSWSGSIRIGVTAADPSSLQLPSSLVDLTQNTWVLSGCLVYHDDDITLEEYDIDLDSLNQGDTIGVIRTASGELHFYMNGEDYGTVATCIPADVYAAVDVFGQCAQVTILQSPDAGGTTDLLLFDTKCGSNACVTNGQRTALRQNASEEFTDGIVLTKRPLRCGEHFEVRLDETVDCWTGSLQIGVTAHDPSTLTFPTSMTDLTSGTWMLTSEGVNNNGKIISDELGETLDDLELGDTVGVIWKSDETIHFTVNGIDQGEAANSVPGGVYGVIDLFAQTSQVTIIDHSVAMTHHGDASSAPNMMTSDSPRMTTRSTINIDLKLLSEEPLRLPAQWKLVKSLDDDEVAERAQINRDVADAIKKLVEETWDYDHVGHGRDARHLTHSCIEVTKVEQIENTHLYKEYERQRKAFCERAARNTFPKVTRNNSEGDVLTSTLGIRLLDEQLIPEINEQFLFHGAKTDCIDAICQQGIDFRVGNAGMFGKGAYFCEKSTKADQYTDTWDGRGHSEHVMILAKVILGYSYIAKRGDNKMVRPPCIHNCSSKCKHPKSEFYNSVMGTHAHAGRRLLFREFIIFEEKQCYPAYLITYIRK